MSRSELQKEALERAKEEFEKYYVEAQNLLIAYIDVDEKLLATQTDKEIAIQQQQQYVQQALAQEQRIAVKEKEARAELQPRVIEAKLSIDISNDKAEALRREAGGIRDKTKYIAEGDAFQNRQVGIAIADAYKAQSDVIGPQILGTLKAFKEIADGNIKITPDVLVTGGGPDGGGNLINALLAMLIKEGALNLPKQIKSINNKSYEEIKETLEQKLPEVPIEKIPTSSPLYNPDDLHKTVTYSPVTSSLTPEQLEQANKEIEDDAEERTKDWPEELSQPKRTLPKRTTPPRTTSRRTGRNK